MWVLLGCVIAIGIVGAVARFQEIRAFRKGNCACGGKLKTFDMDSQGGTGWKCDRCSQYIWTSWVKYREGK